MWPHERSLVQKLRAQPFVLLGVNTSGASVAQLGEFMRREDLPWRSIADRGPAGRGPIAAQWNLSSIPTLYVIDARGVIRHKWAGDPGAEAIDAAVERLLAEARAGGK